MYARTRASARQRRVSFLVCLRKCDYFVKIAVPFSTNGDPHPQLLRLNVYVGMNSLHKPAQPHKAYVYSRSGGRRVPDGGDGPMHFPRDGGRHRRAGGAISSM